MKVSELKTILQDVDDNLNIRLVTDHGQTPMSLNGYGIGYIDEDCYMPEEISEEDADEGVIKVFMLEAF